MFTGIIQNFGKLKAVTLSKNQARLVFCFEKKETQVKQGESIAVNGVCLTAVRIDCFGFEADLVPETLLATNLGKLKVGDSVNIERSLRWNDSVGGHFVTGHVDAVGKVAQILRRGQNWSLLVDAPKTIISKLVPKGSVVCDGVSLTVQTVMKKNFCVAVIPHTLAVTTLGKKKVGDEVNLEIDLLLRYQECTNAALKKNRLSIKTLKKQGF